MAATPFTFTAFGTLTRKNGFFCVPADEEVNMEKIVLAAGRFIGMDKVVAASQMNKPIVTSATEGKGGYVFFTPSHPVCLFVCLCTGSLKKLWTDPNVTRWTG